jgi:hypothetical protein
MVFIPKGKEIPKVIKPKAKADADDESNLHGEQSGSDKQPGTPVKPDSKK